MSGRKWLLVAIRLSFLLLLWRATITAQQQPPSADEVVTKYEQAVGADRFSSIATFIERGDLYGNLTNFWQGFYGPTQSQKKERGTFELYYKAPNLRFGSNLTEDKRIISLHGCNGKVAWYISAYLERKEYKPKAGSEGECGAGFQPMPSFHEANVKIRLIKKKEVEGRAAWEIRVDRPGSQGAETCDFDAETYLLLRCESHGSSVSYSDYREVGGYKLPFTLTREFTNSKLVTVVRELRINAALDDARFLEPEVKGRSVNLNPGGAAEPQKSETVEASQAKAAATGDDTASRKPATTASAGTATEVNFPNFASCTIAELQLVVSELKGLKAARDQEKLQGLLDKVGAKTVDIARNTPNLISRESVIESQHGLNETRHDYDYLILTRLEGDVVFLNEFRVDVKTGEKFRTDEAIEQADLERASHELSVSPTGAPVSQGFATAWVHFYPLNRPQASFRYLGEEKIDGKRTLVLAFAQRPQAVLSPAVLRFQGKNVPMFLQGVAWVDASDFHILRLQTDLLSPLPEVSLHRFTVDIQFVATRIQQVSSVLSLPSEVMVVSDLNGSIVREVHNYSDYRLFRSQSRVVLNP